MHPSSMERMKRFVELYLDKPLKILDVGAQDVNGCYRELFNKPKWEYKGLGLSPDKNIDIVVSDPYNWTEIQSNYFDVVISGQTFEHIEYPWRTMIEIKRVMKPGAICCIISPSFCGLHQYPVDTYRIMPDGYIALARYAGLEPVVSAVEWESLDTQDVVFIGKKPVNTERMVRDLKGLRMVEEQVNDQWFDSMIGSAKESQQTPLTVTKDGSELKVEITNAVIEYMIANRFMIISVGKDTFKQFLLLCSNGQDIAALRLVYEKMDTSMLIDQYKDNAVKLAEVYKQDQANRAFWLQMATTLGGKIISLALGSLV